MTEISPTTQGVVVIGAGQAGGRAIEALRGSGYEGSITLIGSEAHLPYERPPLSKEMLLDKASEQVAWIRSAAWYNEHDVRLMLGATATRIDRDARDVSLADGAVVTYDKLILATGASPRALSVPGGDHPRCHTIRTLEDSRRLRAYFVPDARIVVVGAGFIGLEAAAAARKQGCAVTVLEAGSRAMARGVPSRISDLYAKLHRDNGVVLHFGVAITAITGPDDAPVVEFTDGTTLPADAIVVGIGVVPNDGLATACGLPTDGGIIVDDHGRTTDPNIYAAGDVTRHHNPLLGVTLRLESWQNAQNQAIVVARNIAGHDTVYAEVPWFWSDQYGVNMQITGLPATGATEIVRGDLESFNGLLLAMVGQRLVCAVGLNAARDLRFAKQIISLGVDIDPARLADPSVKLADVLRTVRAA